ncbi:hypothetical protein SAMN06265222_109170 [Neorhodopirellula lusitana]|uniref:Uncharacterized protein n=1 Tax=Neorhodopirellula lusitana TaxID=445327 RepID=A0ABY1QF57_9BACT|nr:hypothetical protein [Neorhodopirellula lusitana]SMP66009.1 hypothetical protein SAMN06265222_109170 [Neorhodopirellula lusitana]
MADWWFSRKTSDLRTPLPRSFRVTLKTAKLLELASDATKATNQMEQLKGLWRDTWWLWCGFVAVVLAVSFLQSFFFLLTLPALPVSFCYFALIRYDDEGNEKADL